MPLNQYFCTLIVATYCTEHHISFRRIKIFWKRHYTFPYSLTQSFHRGQIYFLQTRILAIFLNKRNLPPRILFLNISTIKIYEKSPVAILVNENSVFFVYGTACINIHIFIEEILMTTSEPVRDREDYWRRTPSETFSLRSLK